MSNIVKLSIQLLIGLSIVSCSSNQVKTKNFSVEPFSKNDILVFVKKVEYKSADYEKEKNVLIKSCSKALSSEDYKVFSRVIKEDEAGDFLTKGVILVRIYDDQRETESGDYEKNLYLKFERISSKNRFILPIHGIKATMTDSQPFSFENIDKLCLKAVKSISFSSED